MEVFLMTASNNRLCNFTAQQPISLFYIDIGALAVAPARPEWRRRPLGREAHRAAASRAPGAAKEPTPRGHPLCEALNW